VYGQLQGRHHTKVPTTAAQSPEQLRILVSGGPDDLSVGVDDGGRDEVVAGEAVLAYQVPNPAA